MKEGKRKGERKDERENSDRDLAAVASTYVRGVRNYRSNERVQRKYAPMATARVVCALCSFPLAPERTCQYPFVLCICTRELPVQLLAKRSRVCLRVFRRKILLAANKRLRWFRLVIIHRIYVQFKSKIYTFNLVQISRERFNEFCQNLNILICYI